MENWPRENPKIIWNRIYITKESYLILIRQVALFLNHEKVLPNRCHGGPYPFKIPDISGFSGPLKLLSFIWRAWLSILHAAKTGWCLPSRFPFCSPLSTCTAPVWSGFPVPNIPPASGSVYLTLRKANRKTMIMYDSLHPLDCRCQHGVDSITLHSSPIGVLIQNKSKLIERLCSPRNIQIVEAF